jgi:hypothetical protein
LAANQQSRFLGFAGLLHPMKWKRFQHQGKRPADQPLPLEALPIVPDYQKPETDSDNQSIKCNKLQPGAIKYTRITNINNPPTLGTP